MHLLHGQKFVMTRTLRLGAYNTNLATSDSRNLPTYIHAGLLEHLLNPLSRPRPPRPAMGIWDLWESADPQTSEPGVETELHGMPSHRSHRYRRRGRQARVGGATKSWRADGYKVARSSYQG